MWWLDFLCWQWGSCVFVVYYFAFIKYQTMYTQTQGVRGSIDCCFRMMDFPVRSVLRGSSYFDFQNLGPADLPHFIPCKIWVHGTQEDFTRPERCRFSFLEGSGKTDSLVESAKHFLCVQEFEVGHERIAESFLTYSIHEGASVTPMNLLGQEK